MCFCLTKVCNCGHANVLYAFVFAAFWQYICPSNSDMPSWSKVSRSDSVFIRSPMCRREALNFDLGTNHETHEVGRILTASAVDQCDAVPELAKEIKASRINGSTKPVAAVEINDEV